MKTKPTTHYVKASKRGAAVRSRMKQARAAWLQSRALEQPGEQTHIVSAVSHHTQKDESA